MFMNFVVKFLAISGDYKHFSCVFSGKNRHQEGRVDPPLFVYPKSYFFVTGNPPNKFRTIG
jgi:hypothetical protein